MTWNVYWVDQDDYPHMYLDTGKSLVTSGQKGWEKCVKVREYILLNESYVLNRNAIVFCVLEGSLSSQWRLRLEKDWVLPGE